MTSEKLEFGSEGWISAAHEIAQELVDAGLASGELSADESFSIIETFTHAPAHLSETGAITWGLRLEGGKVSLLREMPEKVNVKLRAEYDVVLPLARMQYIANVFPPPEAQAISRRALALRKMVVVGKDQMDPPAPAALSALHNRLAALTA